jgi:hypothetical protein
MREFLEVGSIDEFYKLAEDKDFIFRIDPFLMIFHYGLIFYINMIKLTAEERVRTLNKLKHKIVYVRDVKLESGILEFIRKWRGKGL